jgi:hypothetical protein
MTEKGTIYAGCGACEICGETDPCSVCDGSFVLKCINIKNDPESSAKHDDSGALEEAIEEFALCFADL